MHLLRIISLLNNSTDEDEQALVKSASELLVLVLTGGERITCTSCSYKFGLSPL